MRQKKYSHVVAAGTFDHFHIGHEDFLEKTLSLGEQVTIGITSQQFANKKSFSYAIESFAIRKQNVERFLYARQLINKATLVSIDSASLPEDIASKGVDAIAVTEETAIGAKQINDERKQRGLAPLHVEVLSFVEAEDKKPISSHRIRKGEINRTGRLSINHEWLTRARVLPSSLRPKLQEPFGILTSDFNGSREKINPARLITVGDVVTKKANQLGMQQKFSCIDFLVERKKKYSMLSQLGFSTHVSIYNVENPPGSITPKLFQAVQEMFEQTDESLRMVLQIQGEEDLSLLVFVLVAPLNFVAFYGQPGKGIVKVNITEQAKEKAYSLINMFN